MGLHNKPQGCDASVAFAAGPFTTKKDREIMIAYSEIVKNYELRE
jgi:hypothetical protein